ncbi:MAG: T9SS type A sorting domain-containing protein [Saprospirales bacterium]|nr:T9SS type A sorting domain-containing protein [Saprospirales bacterium]
MNKKYILTLLPLSLIALLAVWFVNREVPEISEEGENKEQTIIERFEWEFERTKDLSLGYPPVERMLDALDLARRRQAELAGQLSRGVITNPKWRERGPNNIGGRTRVIHIDLNDPTRKTVWAGGVAGGLWKTTDIDAEDPQWQKINDYLDNMAIAALAQDPNNPQIMYMGTGEGYGNFEAVAGLGLFKSVDGGSTWQILPATLTGGFRYSREMIVTPEGHVYAATNTGLYRSKDQGVSFQKVLGSGLGANDEMYDLVHTPANGMLYASNVNHIFRSQSGDPNTWEKITKSPVPTSLGRLEMAVCQQDPDVIYCIGAENGGASSTYVTTDGGQNWAKRARPENGNGTEFTNGQVWYDLDIAVDPSDCNHVITGGVPIRRSQDGAFTWASFGQGIHVDQHIHLFDEVNPDVIYFGNDGGVYKVTLENGGATVLNRNQGYNVTQYYACAMHPDTFSSYFLGGTQDNGSHQLNEWNLTSARNVWGGDGFMCHIDQNEPLIQLVSSQFGNWGVSFNGGLSFEEGYPVNGGFFNPSDYDDESNILYTETGDGDFYRWKVEESSLELVDITNMGAMNISHIRVDENTPNRIYIGTGGSLIRVDNAHTGATVTSQSVGTFGGSISSVDIERGNPLHLLVTISNYGVANSIRESIDGGVSWIGVEGAAVPDNLPDMPVYWGVFNPNDASQAMIATEAGVWTTELLDGAQTVWIPPMPDRGIPLVRTDMLQVRPSDKMVLASTHARGMFTTDVFSDPIARMDFNKVHYLNSPMTFLGDLSLGADTFAWDLGDGTTSTQENLQHTFTALGTYPISLTVNGSLNTTGAVKILPERPVPYTAGQPEYGGDFEGFTEQYGVYHISGTPFERGKSTLPFKDGTKSGENAFVVGLNQGMKHNTHTMLYLPEYDLSQPGIFEFGFWAKHDLENGRDGFRVEYSTDGGNSWSVLGADVKKNWYNTTNTGLQSAAFPEGQSYFSKRESDFTRYFLNISDLAGQGSVAFRFVVKSNETGNSGGLVIDDVTITSYQGELATELIEWAGAFTASTEITLTWKTLPEYFCRRFELERSENGKDFSLIHSKFATGGSTEVPQEYTYSLLSQKNLYFFRLKVINENEDPAYSYEFYSPIITVRRNLEGTEVFQAFPNPFTDYVDVAFTDVVTGLVKYDLFDVAGRLLASNSVLLESAPWFRADLPPYLAAGVYFLRIRIGEEEPLTVKLLKVK